MRIMTLAIVPKKAIRTFQFRVVFPSHAAKNVIQDSISVFSFRTTLKMEFQVLVSFHFCFATTLDKTTLTSTLIGDRNRNRNRKIENGNRTE